MSKFILVVFLVLLSTSLIAQEKSYLEIGVEAQQYPTGSQPGIRLEYSRANKSALELRAGYNVVYHGNLGVHQLEEGGGFGFTLGYRRYFKLEKSGISLGLRSDLWFNGIDWKDNIGTPEEVIGHTDIVVLQPTAIAGFTFLINDKVAFTPTIAFGYEINIIQKGADVGQGPILLMGVQAGRRF